ncbi:hypothetical protein SDC9_133624 [bioreactor metagenome]|uniref:Uncharacterized protein n=1 Tax=bioreactor metagenome TaxID=1076179 RepID=A0A645DBC3_9ZZZZ
MSKIQLVKKYILKEIMQRKIMEGQRVPGCREIAQILSVNKITVNKAYCSCYGSRFHPTPADIQKCLYGADKH